MNRMRVNQPVSRRREEKIEASESEGDEFTDCREKKDILPS